MTYYRLILLGLAASFVVGVSPAPAQGIDDIRCLLASNAAIKVAKDPTQKAAAEATMHFYLGRIDGKFNASQLASAFATQVKSLQGTNLGPIMQSCFQHAQERMRFVQSVGQQLNRPSS